MAGVQLQTVVRHLRRLATADPAIGPTDAQLLDRFVSHGDEAAFELLLWRHGAMVLALCRRILRHDQDAEDAFQATFLTLARKGRSVRGGAVGPWLHTVAYRAALAAKARADRRTGREVPLSDVPAPPTEQATDWRDIRPVLDEEIRRLPARYRVPFVLCHLEGLTVDEAAGRLGRPRGTVGVRVARARERLRARLTGRGLGLSAAALVSALADEASATTPTALIAVTLRTAAGRSASAPVLALTEGVIRTMFATQLKSILVTAAVAVALGAGGLTVRTLAADGPAKEPAAAERLTLRGWGTAIDPDGDCTFTIEKGKLTITVPGTDHDLGIERGLMNSPRVVQAIEGDFIAQVRVSGNFPKGAKSVTEKRRPFHGAGLLLFKDEKTYVRLERAELNLDGAQHHYANWELRRDGEWPRPGGANDGAIDGAAPAWLRLERRGNRVYGSHSADGNQWTALEVIDVELPRKVLVGVSATQDTSSPFSPTFDGFQLFQSVAGGPPAEAAAPAAKARDSFNLNVVWPEGAPAGPWRIDNIEGRYYEDLRKFVPDAAQRKVIVDWISEPGVAATFKVGEIKVVGSSQIAEDAIRERLGFIPGQVITAADLKAAEKKLHESKIFKQPPTVTTQDPAAGEFKTIVITIQK